VLAICVLFIVYIELFSNDIHYIAFFAFLVFVGVVLITRFVSLSSTFHVNTGSTGFMLFLYIYYNTYGLRLDWFSVICIYPTVRTD